MNDTISRQAAIDVICKEGTRLERNGTVAMCEIKQWCIDLLERLPSAQPEPHYCRECKWSRCHINVDKYGNTETYWHCLNWDGGTDETGWCYRAEPWKGEQS